jgi:putative hydrolase of the HAD superfamily
MNPDVRAVLFDLDDTLFDHRGCSQAALDAVQRCHETLATIPFADLERAHSRVLEELHPEVLAGRMPLEDARRERFRRLLGIAGLTVEEALVDRIAVTYRDRYRESRRAIRGAAALLRLVRQHARIGIVSNNLRDEQQQKLEVCGLDSLIDALVVSEEVGLSKPHPQMFSTALERLRCDPRHAAMVGDSWAADILGARAAGIRAIWFNPLGSPMPDTVDDVVQLTSLEPAETAMRVVLGLGADQDSSGRDRSPAVDLASRP